jgi:hypothetical protein
MTGPMDDSRAAALWRRVRGILFGTLRIAFVLVYALGLGPEVAAFWRLDGKARTLAAAGFTAFSLLASVAFGLARALPEGERPMALEAISAGRNAGLAALGALGALLLIHGAAEAWPGIALLQQWLPTDTALRLIAAALALVAAWAGLVALWKLEAVFTSRARADEATGEAGGQAPPPIASS